MRALGEIVDSRISVLVGLNSTLEQGSSRYGGGWTDKCHGIFHSVALVSASLFFVAYLAFQAKKSLLKLSNRRSYIIIGYYGCLWLVCLLNLAWSCLQGWECFPEKKLAWNVLSLLTTSGMLFLEISLVAFLFQGNYASGLESLTRTFFVSGLIVGIDLLLKVIYLFGFGVPLFIDNSDNTQKLKWGLWVIHRLMLTGVYGVILFMYNSKWRERLPARPAFYKYIIVMFALNALALFACAITANGASFGLWLFGVTDVCYHAFYLPLLYVTFLADFFQEEDLNLENVYYSEMKDAGFFDADWE